MILSTNNILSVASMWVFYFLLHALGKRNAERITIKLESV